MNGVMEYWSDGVMEIQVALAAIFFHQSITPLLRHPVFARC
jgi:hypothetical protein